MTEKELLEALKKGLPTAFTPEEHEKNLLAKVESNRIMLGLGTGSNIEFGNPNITSPSWKQNQVSTAPASADKKKLAKWMAAEAKKMGLPPELPVMCVLVENYSFSNPDHGDADSVGLFQQRPSQGWGTKAQCMTPSYALAKFLARAKEKANQTTYNLGNNKHAILSYPIKKLVAEARTEEERGKWLGIWCQMVQISAYPYKYGKMYQEAKALIGM